MNGRWFWGFSLAFSSGGAFYGDLNYILLLFFDTNMLTEAHPNAPTVPMIVFMIYQCMFATITPALITGGAAERLRFRTYLWFLFFWSTLVYCPIAHWVWHPNGWLFKLGALDFAGGTVVHIASGVSALALSLFLGSRKGYITVWHLIRDKIRERRERANGEPKVEELKVVDEESPTSVPAATIIVENPSHTIAPHNIPMIITGKSTKCI
jgi:ammonia channel protein AmtB